MFEQRRFPEAKDRLPDKVREKLPGNAVVVMLEPTDRPSDQRAQKFAYEGVGFDVLHEDKDGTLYMRNTVENVQAYERMAGEESANSLKAPPKASGGVDNETDTLQTTKVSVESLLSDGDDND